MLIYPEQAITVKTLDKFTYNMYLDIYINMLKYNNDSSTILRILGSIVDTSQDVLDDLGYKPRFDLKELDFITIDRFNGFYLDKIPDIKLSSIDTDIITSNIYGYSKYTSRGYLLKEVKSNADWVRHSLPCDCFLGNHIEVGEHQILTLFPNISTNLDISVLNSRITIRPYSGLTKINLIDSVILLEITGIDITGRERKESILVNSYIDYNTQWQYSLITSIKPIGSIGSITIVLYPYLMGEYELWDSDIVDRETFELYQSFMTVDMSNKNLVFNIIRDNTTQFPIPNEPYKLVDLDPFGDDIYTYYIDKSNKLLYTISSTSKLYCFPLIIPKSTNNELDKNKTQYQAINVEYYDDSIAKEYTFYIFPVSKTNDIEAMSIFINGEEYQSDLILDLYRENIGSNRFVIPYSDLFNGLNEAIVEFQTYGLNESIYQVYLSNKSLKPLYCFDLNYINAFSELIGASFLNPYTSTKNIEYTQTFSGNINAIDFSIMKLSNKANILINGYEIINVFDTFNFDESSNTIITSDTISSLSVDGNLIEMNNRMTHNNNPYAYGDIIFGNYEHDSIQ
jgi:hypothetical protein